MCVVSAVGDQWGRDFPQRWPNVPLPPYQPYVPPADPFIPSHPFQPTQDSLRECAVCGYGRSHWHHAAFEPAPKPAISKEDFDALKKEVEELKILLLAAKRFDETSGQPDCQMDEKVALIKRVAELVGVDLDEVFG